ncbi:hypothetical protein HanPSC8_Chr09g0361031 [Helianthus annuus]|nr:hypothetical protein HanPSC8_Chr09g0361031 [Helianthus annuus]
MANYRMNSLMGLAKRGLKETWLANKSSFPLPLPDLEPALLLLHMNNLSPVFSTLVARLQIHVISLPLKYLQCYSSTNPPYASSEPSVSSTRGLTSHGSLMTQPYRDSATRAELRSQNLNAYILGARNQGREPATG